MNTGRPEYPIVHVRWADAHLGDHGWLDLEEQDDDGECIVDTVGFLVPQDEPGGKAGHITIVHTVNNGDVIGLFHIPVAMTRKITVLCQAEGG
jgi:hypothetical protein